MLGLIAVLWLLFASPAYAEQWLQWAQDSDSSSWIDTDSVIERRNHVYYRYQWRYLKTQTSPDGDYDKRQTSAAVDCGAKRSASLKHQLWLQDKPVAELAGHDFITQNLAGTVHAVACLIAEQKKRGTALQLCQYQADINHPICGNTALIQH
ncbi:hypothetical protein EV682_107146 [Iodobacter fluviatilis]|uniref:Surface-adhesin protein E-like domain-containing protein n=1 Tax=Iodobacter fluviatilis TaxID=537 RepID=A0A377SX78_9NEIS|nr:hypothetical protein EV682_107146 [Iodobacter fluviatilis]STR44916.1 Uncharacterised protein [Iodobacter fluviatilis]